MTPCQDQAREPATSSEVKPASRGAQHLGERLCLQDVPLEHVRPLATGYQIVRGGGDQGREAPQSLRGSVLTRQNALRAPLRPVRRGVGVIRRGWRATNRRLVAPAAVLRQLAVSGWMTTRRLGSAPSLEDVTPPVLATTSCINLRS